MTPTMTGCLGLLAFKTGATVPDHHQVIKLLIEIVDSVFVSRICWCSSSQQPLEAGFLTSILEGEETKAKGSLIICPSLCSQEALTWAVLCPESAGP